MNLPITGASTQGATIVTTAVSLSLPIVEKAVLLDKDNAINDTRSSGKKVGGLVLAKNGTILTIVSATGEETTSTWNTVDSTAATIYATPA